MLGKKAQLVLAVVIVGVAAFLVIPRKQPARVPSPSASVSSRPSDHGEGIDRAFASALALYDAPEGATPCESAYNAFQNSIDVAKQQHLKPLVLSLAPREEFLARCVELPSSAQQCLVPRYRRDHDDECAKTKPSEDVVRDMATLVQLQPPVAVLKQGAPPTGSP
jgi:hypothetical protein